jgi:hypothetical protein
VILQTNKNWSQILGSTAIAELSVGFPSVEYGSTLVDKGSLITVLACTAARSLGTAEVDHLEQIAF